MPSEKDQPQPQTFASGLEFIRTNAAADRWFLQIETFDPHEPFFTQQHYKDLYPHTYDGPQFDWPPYRRLQETPEEVQHIRYEYAALVSMCDAYLGKVLDLMDELQLWDDTLLIVNTDHGFLLGEHDWWAKNLQPFYEEIAHPPLFIWDPRAPRPGTRCDALVQMIDMPATLLEFFGVPLPKDMLGVPLRDALATNASVREAAIFGMHGGHLNITDGRYVYMRAPTAAENSPLYEYTLMPTHMRYRFDVEELQDITLAEPFSFTKGCRVMKIAGRSWASAHQFGTLLFDLTTDPNQTQPLQDAAVEERMTHLLVQLLQQNDAPAEQYRRLGLESDILTQPHTEKMA
jgi:arylsulfatase A-like enzyme